MSDREPETTPDHESDQNPEQQGPRPMPRIWVGSLADYNAGRLHGDWLDAAVESDELLAGVKRILATSREPNAEEWGIFDYENFAGYQVGEYEPLEDAARVAQGLHQHGPAFAVWAELQVGDPDRLAEFEDCYLGAWDSPEDWAREVLDDQTLEAELDQAVPDSLRGYVSIDYAAFARDAQLGGDVAIVWRPGGIWVFSTH